MKISVVGIGPGNKEYILPIAQRVIAEADVLIGYSYYFQFVEHLINPQAECLGKDLSEEEARAELAIEKAKENKHVVVISSGDAGIYAMASLVYEAVSKSGLEIELETIPGISAFVAGAGRLGAPIGHDFCCISLSDLMTPWSTIEKRIQGAAMGDFVTSLYNPRSKKRHWQLDRLREIFLEHRKPDTPVALIRQVTREEENITLTTLEDLDTSLVDMFTLVMIGNSQSYQFKNFIVTPRGYFQRKPLTGEEIQQESFREIQGQLKRKHKSLSDQWAVIRCIHTTADFEYEDLYYSTENAVGSIYGFLSKGGEIVTDVTMVQAGISKHLLAKFNNQVFCHLNDEETLALAKSENITRSQAGFRIAIKKHPEALFVVGNAPTALFEIGQAIESGLCSPAGIIAAPVGFVNVIESKLRIKSASKFPTIIIEGRKGGSNVAASLVNAVLTVDEMPVEVKRTEGNSVVVD